VVKLKASSNNKCLIHLSPPQDFLDLLRNDVIGTYFPIELRLFVSWVNDVFRPCK